MKKIFLLFAIFGCTVCSLSARADYPDKPIKLVVPFPPGGNIDATARIIANGLTARLNVAVIVENRPGAAGILGSEFVARATPDGYTMLLGSTGALAPAKALNPAMNLDPVKDFVAASPISRAALVLIVNPTLPIQSVADLIHYAKAHPGKLTIASSGTGTAAHLTAELFQSMSGTQFLHVPYKGSNPAIADLLGGQVDLTFDQLASTLPQIQSGKLRALGVTTLARTAVFPELKTLSESGLPNFESSTTTGLLLPKGTSADAVKKINAEVQAILKTQETQQKFAALGADVQIGTGEDFDNTLAADMQKWAKVVKDAGVQLP